MSPIDGGLKRTLFELLPHQTELGDLFFNAATKPVLLLRAHVGLGKSAALVGLVSRVLRERPAARVLVVVPAALRTQFVERLQDQGTAALLLDRYRFREMLDSTNGSEFWPSGVAIVASREFARQADVEDSLTSARWDLVVCDEAHWYLGPRAETLRRLQSVADRIVLATVPGFEPSDGFMKDNATVVDWRRETLIDLTGRSLDLVPRPLLREVQFSLSEPELNLYRTVSTLSRLLKTETPQQAWIARALFRSVQSSPAALEATLQKLVAGRDADDTAWPETVEDEGADNRGWGAGLEVTEEVRAFVTHAIQEVDALHADSKLSAFGLLSRQLAEASSPRHICVVTKYLASLYYLAAEIESLGTYCRLLHGGMASGERSKVVTQHVSEGGVLMGTQALMTFGLSLPHVTDLILYDVPEPEATLRQVLGRFDRFGRHSQLFVHVLVPAEDIPNWTPEALTAVRRVIGATPSD